MAYPANIAFTFATQAGPIPLSQLDTNFSNLQQGLNSLGNGSGVLNVVNVGTANVTTLNAANVAVASGTAVLSLANMTVANVTTLNASNVSIGGGTANLSVLGTGAISVSSSVVPTGMGWYAPAAGQLAGAINGFLEFNFRDSGAAPVIDYWRGNGTVNTARYSASSSQISLLGLENQVISFLTNTTTEQFRILGTANSSSFVTVSGGSSSNATIGTGGLGGPLILGAAVQGTLANLTTVGVNTLTVNGALLGTTANLTNIAGTLLTLGGANLSVYATPAWTPVLAFGGNSSGITYSTQSGVAAQIGKLVTASFNIVLTSKGNATGAATITGLPVQSASVGSQSGTSPANFSLSAVPAGQPALQVVTSSQTINYTFNSTTGVGSITNANFGNTDSLAGTVVYLAQ